MSFYGLSDIIFPHLGITFKNIPTGISVFGFNIAFYGIIIACAMLVGYMVAEKEAKKYSQNIDLLLDFAIIVIIIAVIGARLYYVIFHWDSFKDEPLSILNLRTGGLAIYGGVIASIATAVVFTGIKKLNRGAFCDVCIPGLVIGQVIGRWANFFNREAFGKYTDGLFAMQMNIKAVGGDYLQTEAALRTKFANRPDALEKILEQIANNVTVNGETYIQAHPTFLYESMWNLGVFAFLIFYAKRKKFNGELLSWYVVLYGIGRFWIESLRTDQLFFLGTAIPVSMLVAVLMVLCGAAVIVYNYAGLGNSAKNRYVYVAPVEEPDMKNKNVAAAKKAVKVENKKPSKPSDKPESKVKIVK